LNREVSFAFSLLPAVHIRIFCVSFNMSHIA